MGRSGILPEMLKVVKTCIDFVALPGLERWAGF